MPESDRLTVPRRAGDLSTEVAESGPPPGNLGTFALIGAAAGTVPMPWVPHALARRIRGALVHDVAARHRVGLSKDARTILANPLTAKQKQGPVNEAFAYIGRKILVRFGPLSVLPPLRAALETYVLGHLFDRYLARRAGEGRIDGREAELVRAAIDRAVIGVATREGGLQWPQAPETPGDERDEITQLVDGLLRGAATVPSWVLHRLDAAFDDALATAS